MKNVFLALAFLALCKLTWAQEPRKHMFSATYHDSKEVKFEDLNFLSLYYANPANPLMVLDYIEVSTSYYSYELPIQYSIFFSKDVFLFLELSGNMSEYVSSYSYYQNNFSEINSAIEYIKGKGGSYSCGLGKAFYLTDNNKIMIMPYLFHYIELYKYAGEGDYNNTSSNNSTPIHFSGHNGKSGVAIGLNVNFQLSKHFGLGFNFRKFCKYEARSSNSRNANNEGFTGFEFNPRQIPQMHLIYYFNTNNPNLF